MRGYQSGRTFCYSSAPLDVADRCVRRQNAYATFSRTFDKFHEHSILRIIVETRFRFHRHYIALLLVVKLL
jgi:hypothetical protein